MRLQKIFYSILLPLGGAAVAVGTENSTVVAHGVNRISHCSWECAPPILVVRHYLWFVAPIRLPKTTLLGQSETTLIYWAKYVLNIATDFLSHYWVRNLGQKCHEMFFWHLIFSRVFSKDFRKRELYFYAIIPARSVYGQPFSIVVIRYGLC